MINLQNHMPKQVYLEAVVTNNTTEGDDSVSYSQETKCWLHVSAALLQHKINCALVIILGSRVQFFPVNRRDHSFLFF